MTEVQEKFLKSWGQGELSKQKTLSPSWPEELAEAENLPSLIGYGKGRSYGDSCLNDEGVLIDTSRLKHVYNFDRQSGIISVGPGITIGDIIEVALPQGYFVPVTPGTKYVTIAGAVANDVHGKNHHRRGSIGCHIKEIELIRSDSKERVICSLSNNSELFKATIGGLGLTGLITRVDLQLIPASGPYIDMETVKFRSLEEFLEISNDSDDKFEYTVAWLDVSSQKPNEARGHYIRGNHSTKKGKSSVKTFLSAPLYAPNWLLNQYTVKAFNTVYFNKQLKEKQIKTVHYNPFFYPLDSVSGWNKVYGKRGFYQFQCVVPETADNRPIRDILEIVFSSKMASFLTVLKKFGTISSPGILSFPRPGITICLDFPNNGPSTYAIMKDLEQATCAHDGAMYPAKDAVMGSDSFKQFYPRWEEFTKFIDPKCSSNFWRRVMGPDDK